MPELEVRPFPLQASLLTDWSGICEGVKERHLESIIQSTLQHIVLVHLHPRTLIQVTLQVTEVPEDDRKITRNPQASSVRSPVLAWGGGRLTSRPL
jgi:hypothetical protein